ncbi:MAG: hypothetical protein EXR71_01660 [Myxococcales bacterium]|nr:hypothetical protein [Myxococcales bacterium]
MVLFLLGCWQPDAYAPPPPAQVEASDVLAGTAAAIERPARVDGDAPEEAGPPAPADDQAVSPPVAEDIRPRSARTVGKPLTLVGDDGAPLQVVGDGIAVTVLMEGADRVKVRCDGCRPVQEGWLQRGAVSP